MKTVILNGGRIDRDFALSLLRREGYDYLIAVDHGMEFAKAAELTPDEILGDFDSGDPSVKAYFEKKQVPVQEFPPQKDAPDMALAMERALEIGSSEILVLGATGTRMDHVLGTIQALALAADARVPCCLVDPNNRIRMAKSSLVIRKSEQYGKYVSLLPHGGCVEGLTLRGFFYPLTDYSMPADSFLGISNEITEEEAVISFHKGTLLVIESRD